MIGEVVIFCREQGIDEIGGNVGELDWRAAHFAKLCDQLSVAGVDPQRNLQLDASQRLYGRQARTKIEKRAAQHEQQPAEHGNERPPEKLQQTNQGFWISRLRNGFARQGSAQLRRVDDTEKNARHYKHFSLMGVMSRMSEQVLNGSHFLPSVSYGLH